MKNLLFTIAFLIALLSSAQYDKLSIELNAGPTKIRDVTSVQPMNYDLGARYMLNTMFGAKLSLNYTNLRDYEYQSASLMGIANAGRIMGFEDFTDWWTILVGVGGNYEYNHNETNEAIFHRLSNFHMAGNVTNEFKLSRSIFLTAGLNVVTGVNSRPEPSTNYTETTSILKFNAGIVIALGKHDEHADWYIEPIKKDSGFLQPTIIDKTVTNNPVTNNYYTTTGNQYVYFKHDSDVIDLDYLDNIEKAVERAKTSITLVAYCSNVGNVEYNLGLAKRRGESVKRYAREIGFEGEITIEAKGIDFDRGEIVHDAARRVELIIDKQ